MALIGYFGKERLKYRSLGVSQSPGLRSHLLARWEQGATDFRDDDMRMTSDVGSRGTGVSSHRDSGEDGQARWPGQETASCSRLKQALLQVGSIIDACTSSIMDHGADNRACSSDVTSNGRRGFQTPESTGDREENRKEVLHAEELPKPVLGDDRPNARSGKNERETTGEGSHDGHI